MIILLAIICLSALIFFHELGHFLVAKIFKVKVEEFGFGFPPKILAKKIGETVYSLNALPFGGFVKLFGEDEKIGGDGDSQKFSNQPVWRRSVIVLAGVAMNIIVGWLILSAALMIGSPPHLMIAEVASDSPAEAVGLQKGDVVLNADFAGDVVLSDPINSEDFIRSVKNNLATPMNLNIQRGRQIINLAVTSRESPPAGEGPLGVALVDIGLTPQPFFQSLVQGFKNTLAILGAVVVGFFHFLTSVFVDRHVLETVSGPVGIFAIMAQAGSLGLIYIFQLTALISLNLAVLNLIPFPALDGGRFLFLLIEKIKKTPVPWRIQAVINAVGLAALLVLMILVTIKDVSRL